MMQVRDAQHLAIPSQLLQRAADGFGHRAADAGVHLVEHQCPNWRFFCRNQLNGKADASQLTTRSHLRQRTQRQAWVRGDIEGH